MIRQTLCFNGWKCPALLLLAALCAWAARPVPAVAGGVVMKIAMVADEEEQPAAAGKAAAEQLLKTLGGVEPKVVILSECFEDRENKEKLIEGVCSVLPRSIVVGGATYGSFTQAGCTDFDSVCLLGIGGPGVGVSTALVTEMGTARLVADKDQSEIRTRLHAAGAKLAKRLKRTDDDRLLIVVADAHSPKNQFLVEGLQKVLGADFPITGGCANKNAGQTFVYYRGKLQSDSAVAVMLSGSFRVAMSGRQANENEQVIATAQQGAAEAFKAAEGKPLAVLAFNCAGRRSKLKDYDEELAAMQKVIGRQMPLFGCYCAGEMGPLDTEDRQPGVLSGGSGWHVMFSVITE